MIGVIQTQKTKIWSKARGPSHPSAEFNPNLIQKGALAAARMLMALIQKVFRFSVLSWRVRYLMMKTDGGGETNG